MEHILLDADSDFKVLDGDGSFAKGFHQTAGFICEWEDAHGRCKISRLEDDFNQLLCSAGQVSDEEQPVF